MRILVELIIAGLSVGGIYALISFSFSLMISTTRVLNVSHGAFVVWGAGFVAIVLLHFKFSPFVAFPMLVLFFAGVSLLFYRVIVRVIMKKDPRHLLGASILGTFGLTVAMESGLGTIWMTYIDPNPTFIVPLILPPVTLFGISLSTNRLAILILVGLIVLGFHLLLQKTYLGRSGRAMAQNFEGFFIIGLNPQRVATLIVLIVILTTALSGVLYIVAIPLTPYDGMSLTLKSLIVIILAGVGSLPGTLIAGSVLGLTEVLGSYVLGAVWAPVLGYALLLLVLIFRPTGLFGKVTI